MTNFRTLSIVLSALAIVFIASTGYLAVFGMAAQTTTILQSTSSSGQAGSSQSVNIAYKPSLNFYLTNGSGWTFYLFTNDTQNSGVSTCYGGCASFWPAFHGSASSLALPPGVSSSSFGTITRTDGTKQLTYKGWPLYMFAGDKSVGDTNGQGKFGTWFVVNIPALNIPGSSSGSQSTTQTSQSSTTAATVRPPIGY